MKTKLLTALFFMFFMCQLQAQVTIGTLSDPQEGALLQLKENDNPENNSTLGFLLPRIKLTHIDQLYPMFQINDADYNDEAKKAHTGLMVYNLTDDLSQGLCRGTYAWNGNEWERLEGPCSQSITERSQVDFICESLTNDAYLLKEQGNAFGDSLEISYTSTKENVMGKDETVEYEDGLSIKIPEQTIEISGVLTFLVQSDGSTPEGIYQLSLSKLSTVLDIIVNTTCDIEVEIFIDHTPANLDIACPLENEMVTETAGASINRTFDFRYTVTGMAYQVTGGTVGSEHGLIATVEEQTLEPGSGVLSITISGTAPNESGLYTLPVHIEGTSCVVPVDITYIVSAPPPTCLSGKATAAVFSVGDLWYAIGLGTYNTYTVPKVYGPYATEDLALRDPNALQFCNSRTPAQNRCIPVYERSGRQVARFDFNSNSYQYTPNLLIDSSSCNSAIKMNPGEHMEVTFQGSVLLGGIVTMSGEKYLGAIRNGTAGTLTTKGLK
jgi:hypothetical protein